jgi:hypothetical protein
MDSTTHNLLATFRLVILEPGLRYECRSQSHAFQIDFDNNNMVIMIIIIIILTFLSLKVCL